MGCRADRLPLDFRAVASPVKNGCLFGTAGARPGKRIFGGGP